MVFVVNVLFMVNGQKIRIEREVEAASPATALLETLRPYPGHVLLSHSVKPA